MRGAFGKRLKAKRRGLSKGKRRAFEGHEGWRQDGEVLDGIQAWHNDWTREILDSAAGNQSGCRKDYQMTKSEQPYKGIPKCLVDHGFSLCLKSYRTTTPDLKGFMTPEAKSSYNVNL